MIFVDTAAWLNIVDDGQNPHDIKKAKTFLNTTTDALFTSDLVIAETYKWLIQHDRPTMQTIEVIRTLVAQELATILPIEQDDRKVALAILQKYGDQALSYEDAITAALAARYRIKKIFSFDRHFLLFPGLERVPS
jgi:uncharacterized protein